MHTPGPWTVDVLQELTDAGERRPASYISSSQGWAEGGRTIAIVGHWIGRPNPEDDARLIAAAPELLEALEGFLKLHTTFMADAGFNPPICECELCVAGRKAKSHADTLKGE